VFLVNIDYNEYFEIVSIIPVFLGSTYFWWCIIFSKQAKKTKNQLKLFLKTFKIGLLLICGDRIITAITLRMRIVKK
jgi:putative effector of murein hydrolase